MQNVIDESVYIWFIDFLKTCSVSAECICRVTLNTQMNKIKNSMLHWFLISYPHLGYMKIFLFLVRKTSNHHRSYAKYWLQLNWHFGWLFSVLKDTLGCVRITAISWTVNLCWPVHAGAVCVWFNYSYLEIIISKVHTTDTARKRIVAQAIDPNHNQCSWMKIERYIFTYIEKLEVMVPLKHIIP